MENFFCERHRYGLPERLSAGTALAVISVKNGEKRTPKVYVQLSGFSINLYTSFEFFI